jgi:hypothetical protein
VRVNPAVWKFGPWIAAVRLVALWSQVIGFRYGDWRQLPWFLYVSTHIAGALRCAALAKRRASLGRVSCSVDILRQLFVLVDPCPVVPSTK